jgi:hypothetical protein
MEISTTGYREVRAKFHQSIIPRIVVRKWDEPENSAIRAVLFDFN